MSLTDTLQSLGVNTSAPAVTNFLSNGNFQTYAPTVAQAANSQGVDPTLALSLVGTESSWNPNAMSSTGAYGLTQTLPSTAAQPGYGLSSWSPYEANSNVTGGVGYLSALIDNNDGDVAGALTDYNGNSNPNYASSVMAGAGMSSSGNSFTNASGDVYSIDPTTGAATLSGSGGTPTATGGASATGGISGTGTTANNGTSTGTATGSNLGSGTSNGVGVGSKLDQIQAWIAAHAVLLVVILIGLLLIVFGSAALLHPVVKQAAKYIPPVE